MEFPGSCPPSVYGVIDPSGIPIVLLVTGGSHGLVKGAALASIWSGEQRRKKEWFFRRRPGQLTAVLAT